jgi:hypothetical protein
MDKCLVKKGMFVLSACNAPSVAHCDDCSVSVCASHSQNLGPKVLCPDCFAKANPEMFNPKAKTKGKLLEDNYYQNYNMWYFSTRYNYYNSSNYNPFTQDDYRAFDNNTNADFVDEQDSGNFFDS